MHLRFHRAFYALLSIPLTDRKDDEENQEGVHHWHDRQGEGRDHPLEHPHPSEEPNHAKDPHKAQHSDRDADWPKRHKGHDDYQGIKHAPGVAQEGLEWISNIILSLPVWI